MSSLFRTSESLPLSQSHTAADSKQQGILRRLSSLSLNSIRPISSPSIPWSFRRSKSVLAVGEFARSSLRKWWEWGRAWILSRKPIFAVDLELNEEQKAALGFNKESWRSVFYKARLEVGKLIGSDHLSLPRTFRYDDRDSYNNHSRNFNKVNRSTQG